LLVERDSLNDLVQSISICQEYFCEIICLSDEQRERKKWQCK
jgi:hypothetical protein